MNKNRPLADKRPIGPFAQLARRPGGAEVNIYFEERGIPASYTNEVEDVIQGLTGFSGPVEGPFGALANAVSFQIRGNTTTLERLDELKDEVEDEIGAEVDDVEVIW